MIRLAVILVVIFAMTLAQRFYYRRNWDRGLKFEIAYKDAGAFEGQTVGFIETVYNSKGLPLPYVTARYKQSEHLTQLDLAGKTTYYGRQRDTFFVVPRRRQVARKSSVLCEKRGYYAIEGATLTTSDLFLTSHFSKDIPLHTAITVYPREIEIDEEAIPYKLLMGDILTKRFILPDPYEFIGIREYQPFDSLKQINFGAWARTGHPMTNILGHTISQEVRIVLNVSRYTDMRREGVYESVLRLAAFLSRKYLESGIPVSFVTNGLDCITKDFGRADKGDGMRQLEAILEILARIDLFLSQLEINNVHIKEFLPSPSELNATGCAVALISSYADDAMYQWHDDAVAQGAKVFWVAPCLEWEKPEYRACVRPWEVDNT